MRSRSRHAPLVGALALAVVLAGCTGEAGDTSPPPPPASASPASSSLTPVLPFATDPAELAADEALAQTLDEELADPKYDDLRSMLVLADGRTVYERYFDSQPGDRQHLWSVTKSVIGTLVGIAIDQGRSPRPRGHARRAAAGLRGSG